MKSTLTAVAIAIATFATATIAVTPADVVKSRQDSMKQVGRANKAIREELGKPAPSLAIVRANSELILAGAKNAFSQLPAGTDNNSGLKTKALPVIWQQKADFGAKSSALLRGFTALRNAAATNNVAQVNAVYRTLKASCKDCHDTYVAD